MFCYNVDEEKKLIPALPMFVWVFSEFQISSHISMMCMWGEFVYVHRPSLSKSGCGCECALQWKGGLARVGTYFAP